MDMLHSVCSSVDEHFDCFHLLTVRNNAAVNICVRLCVEGMDLFCLLPSHHLFPVGP